MVFAWLTALFGAATFGFALPLFRHALQRSLGTLMLVLFVPGYAFVYAFSQFDHPRRHWLAPALLGAALLFATAGGLAVHARAQALGLLS